MQFIVQFYTQRGRLVDEDLSAPGMDTVDDVREHIGRKISLEALDITCPYYDNAFNMEIPEESARKIAFFKGNTKLEVKVPKGYFSRYLMYKPNFDYDRCSWFDWICGLRRKIFGSVPKKAVVSVRTVIDQKQILKDWIAEGSPVEWGVTNE